MENKIYGVYYAYSKWDVLPDEECSNPDVPRYPASIARIGKYPTVYAQLDAYANTKCPASQLVEADSEKEFNAKISELKKNFEDEEWLKENIDPYV